MISSFRCLAEEFLAKIRCSMQMSAKGHRDLKTPYCGMDMVLSAVLFDS